MLLIFMLFGLCLAESYRERINFVNSYRYPKERPDDLYEFKLSNHLHECVYNSECKTICETGSGRCLANTCFCEKIEVSREQHFKCVNQSNGTIPTLVYYDPSHKRCIDEPIINTETITESECLKHHDVYQSIIDGRKYCKNELSSRNILCYENRMCGLSTKFFHICWNGICHFRQVKNITRYILTRNDCDHKETSYCKEKNYSYFPVSIERHSRCSLLCRVSKQQPGIAMTHRAGCSCVKRHNKLSSIIT